MTQNTKPNSNLHSEPASLYLGKSKPKTVTLVTDDYRGSGLKGLVIRNIASNRKNGQSKYASVLLKQNHLMVFSAKGTPGGISLKNFILGPNFISRINESKMYDFTEANYHSVVEPATEHVLICFLRCARTKEIGFRYFDVDQGKCVTVMSSYNEIINDLAIVDLKAPQLVHDWVRKENEPGFYYKSKKTQPETVPTTTSNDQIPDPVKQPVSTAEIGMVGPSGVQQNIATKELSVPAGAIPVNVEIKIPIPYTDVFITVLVTTK